MATAFDTFDQYAFGHYSGQIEDRSLADVVSRLASGSAIGYGRAVVDVDERSAKLPGEGDTPTAITVRETVRDNPAGDDPTPEYPEDTEMSAIRVGRVWVVTDVETETGDQVYVVPDTGELTNDDDGGGNIEFPGATFKSAPDQSGASLIQLNGSD